MSFTLWYYISLFIITIKIYKNQDSSFVVLLHFIGVIHKLQLNLFGDFQRSVWSFSKVVVESLTFLFTSIASKISIFCPWLPYVVFRILWTQEISEWCRSLIFLCLTCTPQEQALVEIIDENTEIFDIRIMFYTFFWPYLSTVLLIFFSYFNLKQILSFKCSFIIDI